MDNFLVLFRGESIENTRLVSLTSDPTIIKDFAARLLANQIQTEDPVLQAVQGGTQKALKKVANARVSQ